MPEGHTIHRLAREHNRLLVGHPVRATSPQGRFADGAARIDGRVLERTDAHGKHLFHRYGDLWLHVHLGLYGKFSTGTLPPPEPRGALRLRLLADDHWVDLRGPTACEVLSPPEVTAIRARLGPDPLRRDADAARAWARLSRSRVAIGALLMDQTVLAGIGNVYRAEILYRHRVEPHRPGRDLPRTTWDELWPDLVTLMRAGVRAGRIVTTRPADRPGGRLTRDKAHYVYRRAGLPCRVCGTEVRTEVMVGRNLFWCPTCQR
ncbi:MAG TPA: DNA-formamidopyrimidine glycosylase family protein [Mycobacteriales bacterium]|nr:DNA-formamidopyrimidine glycosylase family protein [Mycobacteriales bacterium]